MKFALYYIALAFSVTIANSQETEQVEEKLVFKTEWGGERITLPPDFAPDMKLKGIEVIRFAPGMFDPKSESFFSYAFVFAVSEDQKLTEEVIKGETLTYYRGLSKSVSGGKVTAAEAGKFTFELKKAKAAKAAPASIADPKQVMQYSGKLDWIEPFATKKAQVLHFELQSWSDPQTKRNYLFVCTSPQKADDEAKIWKELRKIRSDFEVKPAPKK